MELKRYLGIVAIANAVDSDELEAYLPELFPVEFNQLQANAFTNQFKDKTEYQTKHTITCIYFGKSNWSIPNMHEGEQIEVFHHEPSDQYYWLPLGRDDRLRYREKTKVFCANKNWGNDALDEDHTYFFEINTRMPTKEMTKSWGIQTNRDGVPVVSRDGKYIEFSTCLVPQVVDAKENADNEEVHRYRFKINTYDGTVLLEDNNDNFFYLESTEHRWTLQNTDGTKLILDKTRAYLYALESITLDSDIINVFSNTFNKRTLIDHNEIVNGECNHYLNNQSCYMTGNYICSVAGELTGIFNSGNLFLNDTVVYSNIAVTVEGVKVEPVVKQSTSPLVGTPPIMENPFA